MQHALVTFDYRILLRVFKPDAHVLQLYRLTDNLIYLQLLALESFSMI